jgi:hypothetical protein
MASTNPTATPNAEDDEYYYEEDEIVSNYR